jgi:ubiquinone biosynthesis protein
MGRYSERRSSWARQIGLRSMLDEFSSTLLEELDYYAEAHNMLTLAKNMEPIEGVHIPALYRELSSRRVLTQEFVRGVKISDVDAMRRAGLDVAQVGEAALRAAIKMLLIDGFFHADPHPGNLFVNTDTGVVTFLDCGMVGELTVAQRAHMVVLLWTFVAGDITAMAGQLRSLSVPFRPVDDKAFARAFEHKMSRYDRGSKADVKAVLSSAMGVLRDHGLRLDPQLTLALKAMAQSSAFFTPLAPPDRPFTEAALEAVRDLAEQTFTEDFMVDAAKKQGIRLASQAAQEAPDYLKGLLSWRDQLKKGRLTIYLDTSAVDRQVEQLRGITAIVVVALLVGAAMIASSVAALVFGQHGPHFLARIAEAAFVASLGVAAVLVVGYLGQMLRRRRKE